MHSRRHQRVHVLQANRGSYAWFLDSHGPSTGKSTFAAQNRTAQVAQSSLETISTFPSRTETQRDKRLHGQNQISGKSPFPPSTPKNPHSNLTRTSTVSRKLETQDQMLTSIPLRAIPPDFSRPPQPQRRSRWTQRTRREHDDLLPSHVGINGSVCDGPLQANRDPYASFLP